MSKKYKTRQSTHGKKLIMEKDATNSHVLDISQVKIDNPFKTKFKQIVGSSNINRANITHDADIKKQYKQFKRPYFSPVINSYEADIAFIENNKDYKLIPYLFLININTRYLFIRMLNDKEKQSLKRAFDSLIYNGLRINSLRCDAEPSILALNSSKYFEERGINFFSNSSPYVNKNRIVDRVIRTIRDMYFTITNNQNINPLKQHNILQQLVTIYNHTFHTSINMAPVEMTYEEHTSIKGGF